MSGAGYAAVAVGGCALGWLGAWLAVHPRRSSAVGHQPASDPLEREILRRSTTGYLVLNHQGRTLLANDRAHELGVLIGGIVDPAVLAAAERAAVSGEPVDLEIRPVHPPSLTAPAAPTAVQVVVHRIDDDRIMVSATDESAAQRLEAVRRDFVANVSHELKTPVAAIGLLAEATLDSADDADSVRHFAGRLHSESIRLGALVSELITLSRLQGADPQADPVVVEVDAVVDDAIGRLAGTAETAGITVVADQTSGLLVKGDRALLTMALANLISNAIHYSAAGTQVSVSRTAADGYVRIAVTDRGVGIAPEYTERVFERFFRVDPARSRSTGGTGLGLAIVKQVATNHGGMASVWSRPGTGSTFTLSLPQFAGPGSRGAGAIPQSTGAQKPPPPAVHRGAA